MAAFMTATAMGLWHSPPALIAHLHSGTASTFQSHVSESALGAGMHNTTKKRVHC